ncbi:acetate CoA-transferase subunit alpha [Cupriavidus pauculus]|uniref:acetate CoA-transferase subunit alpha n=1 Tax=Cupriavidus pauculus TaxID=82633 RepID=UPI001FD53718|nr:acetate CoA-transferase subunit alpha [Cupriavidus pauculus]
MQSKIISIADAAAHFRDGISILFGGFMGVGTPPLLIEALLDSNARDLVLIGNDTAFPDVGVGQLISAKRVRKVVASHIGTNAETGRQMMVGEMEVELVPQGTLAERIRAGGAGLGGVLTATGLGTVVEEGKSRINVQGRDFLLELPIRADVALLHASRSDRAGNLQYRLSSRNFNPVVALAGEVVLAQADEIVEIGELDPDSIMTPAALVDGVVEGTRS